MPEIILHIGNYKTGSSSIQGAIANNRSRLISEGYYVPRAGFTEGAHHDWARSWMQRPMAPEPEPLYESIRKEISRTKCDRILVSSEVLFSGEVAQNLVNALPGNSFRVICYLRRQDHFYSAFYHQLIKHPHFREAKPATIELLRSHSCVGYLAALERWAAAIGDEAIAVFPFEKCQLASGLLPHFFGQVGVENPDSFVPPNGTSALNVTIHNELLEFLSLANSMKFETSDHLALLKLLDQIAGLPGSDSVFHKANVFSPRVRREILRSCDEENREILKRFVPGQMAAVSSDLLFSEVEPKDDSEWRESYLDQDALARIFASIWVLQQNESFQLLNRLSTVRRALESSQGLVSQLSDLKKRFWSFRQPQSYRGPSKGKLS